MVLKNLGFSNDSGGKKKTVTAQIKDFYGSRNLGGK
jgi:hypothetical protein